MRKNGCINSDTLSSFDAHLPTTTIGHHIAKIKAKKKVLHKALIDKNTNSPFLCNGAGEYDIDNLFF